MASFFLEIFNLSMAACWIIGAVFAVRMLFVKSMPKWLVCCLWGLVAIRLLIPVTVESNISLVPNQQLELYIPSEDVGENSVFIEESVPTKEEVVNDSTVKVPITNETVSSPVIDEAVSSPVIDEAVSSPVTDEAVSAPVTDEAVSAPVTDENVSVPEQNTVIGDQNNVQNGINENGNIQNNVQVQSTVRKNQISVSFVGIAAIVWAVGFCIMTLYSILSYILLKRRVRMSFPCGDKVRKGEGIDSPFVLGFLRPRIYIPFGLSQRTEECVIAHERAHLQRRDYIIKPLAFLILSVHWFNPFVWVAYILLCRDIEYACDERVVKGLDTDERKAYAFALLECAISHRRIAACPVAFGETGVKERVKNTMKYKKPAFWIIVICVIVCITVAVLFLTTGVSESDNSDTSSDVSDTSSETSDNAENGVYTQVDSFINEGKFEEAYKLLLTVKAEQKAKDMLKDFLVVRETESQYGRGNNGTGLIDEFKTEYDANGNPVKITKLGSNRDIQTVTQMSYDKDNNLLTKDIYYSGAENPKFSIKYTYDENGWLIKEFHTDRIVNSLNSEQTFEYVYDSHGNVVEKRSTTNYFGFEAVEAVEVVRYVLKYDENGRLIEKYNEEKPEYVTYYSYYDNGVLKKEWSDGWLEEYDENGNIVKSDTGDEKDDYVYNADGKLLKHICDDGKSITVYEYTYDENGFLVKKTADSDEYGVTTWQYYNDAYGNPEKMALTHDSGKDDGYIYHYSGYKYFYRPQKKSEGNSEKNPNDSVQKDYIDGLFTAEFVEYEDLGKYENCVRFVSDKEYNVMDVLITPKTTIYDFRIYSLFDNIDTVILENILFEAKSISADKPLLAEIEFGDILAENGISFTDENGNTHLYKLLDNPYDGKLIVYDVTAESSEASEGTLIVNGIDITKGSGVKIYDDRAELPFVAIMEALGISFEWKTDSTAIMTYGSIRPYLLDVKKGELTDYVGGDGRNHFTAYSDSSLEFTPLEKEILIDNINASAFFSEMGFVFRISYFDINFKDKIISIGRDDTDYQCTLIVNGNDITTNKYAVMKRDDGNYTLLSFVPIMEELGAKFEWESDYVAKIEFRGKIYTLNIEECELIAEGNNVNLISPVPGGTRKCFADKKALTVDDVTLKQFFDIAGVNALYNYDKRIVTISAKSSGNETSEPEPHVHVYGDWKTITAATCQSTGVIERVCSCGDKQLQSVNMTQHKYVNGVCSCGAVDSASNIEDGTLTFSLVNGGYKVSGMNFTGSEVIIPSTFMGKPVVEIDQDSFVGNRNIERVVIPKTVKTIGNHAFLHCVFLREVIFEEGSELISIGDSAFNNTAIVSITLPEGLKTIGEGAFNSCDDMKEIALPSTLKSIGRNAFRYSTVSKVTVNDVGKWCTVSFDGKYANPAYIAGKLYSSDGSLVTRVNVPNGTTEISAYAFCGVKTVESISIPSSVKYIGVDAFAECKTLDVYITDLAKWAQVSVASADSLPGKRLFLNGGELKNVVIPSGVTSVGSYAFGFSSLTSVTMPDTVTTVGEGAFYGCSNLQSIKLSKNLTEISADMFRGSAALKSIEIPDSVRSIGASAFKDCISLESMFIPASVTYIGEDAFQNACGSLKEFEFEVKDGWVCASASGDRTIRASDLSTTYNTIAKVNDYTFAPWVRR